MGFTLQTGTRWRPATVNIVTRWRFRTALTSTTIGFAWNRLEQAKAIFQDVSFTGPMAGYWRFVIEEAPNQDVYSQVGRLLVYCRKQGTPLEPALSAAGFKGCKKLNPTWREFVVFDPEQLQILSVTTHQSMATA